MAQTFQLISGSLVNDLLTKKNNRISELLASPKSSAEIIEVLYWSALSRPPSREELTATLRHLESAPDRRGALEDITWALLNSSEFLLRR